MIIHFKNNIDVVEEKGQLDVSFLYKEPIFQNNAVVFWWLISIGARCQHCEIYSSRGFKKLVNSEKKKKNYFIIIIHNVQYWINHHCNDCQIIININAQIS